MEELVARVQDDIRRFDYPEGPWTVPPADTLDVLIIGAGQTGIVTALRLRRESVTNVLLLDEADPGLEGPWATFARMPTLRTPKGVFGVEGGLHSAAFDTWYDTREGAGAFADLTLIPRQAWVDYLAWLRDTTGIAVRNGTRVVDLVADGEHWLVVTESPSGRETHRARKVVVCTGLGGAGGARVPGFLRALDSDRWAHSSADIDFTALAGRDVAVIGLGASAFDNAATALEHGAARVLQFGRRPKLPRINVFRYLEKKGLFRGQSTLPDALKLEFSREELSVPVPPTEPSLERCARHAGYELRLGSEILGAAATETGIELETAAGPIAVDFVIAGTGFQVDLRLVPWLSRHEDEILRWGDVYPLGGSSLDREIGAHPKLAAGMTCQPRHADSPAALRNLHLFNVAAHVDYGIAAVGLNGLPWTVDDVVRTLCTDLLAEDAEAILAGFRDFAAEARHDVGDDRDISADVAP